VASVEVTPKSAELDALRVEVPRWEESIRRRSIGEGIETAWVKSTREEGELGLRGKGWERPLMKRGGGRTIVGEGAAVLVLVGLVYLFARPTGRDKVDKSD
jgi:hypothetical protein